MLEAVHLKCIEVLRIPIITKPEHPITSRCRFGSIRVCIQSPDSIFERLAATVREQKVGLIVGTSLGRFLAAVLSGELQLPVILVNPCLMPFLHFFRLGFEGEITPFIPMFGKLEMLDINKVSSIVGDAAFERLLPRGARQFCRHFAERRSVSGAGF